MRLSVVSTASGVFRREHTLAAVGEAGQLQCILVGFGPAVDQKQPVVFIAADASQPLGELLLQGVDDAVGVETQLRRLPGDGLHIVRMAVPHADDGVASIEIQILLPLIVPDPAALSLDDIDVEERINVE